MSELRKRYKVPRRDYVTKARVPAKIDGIEAPKLVENVTEAHHSTVNSEAVAYNIDAIEQISGIKEKKEGKAQFIPYKTTPSAEEKDDLAFSSETLKENTSARQKLNIKLPNKKQYLVSSFIAFIAVVLLAVGAYLLNNHHSYKPTIKSSLPQNLANSINISTYFPTKLPSGYTYNNDIKALKQNVLFYTISAPGNQLFYITQQPVPSNFDFNAFDKKFLNPKTFSSDSGTATAGVAGANLIGSVQTNKNTWVILNSTSASSLTELEIIVRSLELKS